MKDGDFQRDAKVQDAVLRRLAIIGEAVKQLPAGLRTENPDIPWSQIAGMRDILTHEYFGVNVARVWLVIQEHLAPLKERVREIERNA